MLHFPCTKQGLKLTKTNNISLRNSYNKYCVRMLQLFFNFDMDDFESIFSCLQFSSNNEIPTYMEKTSYWSVEAGSRHLTRSSILNVSQLCKALFILRFIRLDWKLCIKNTWSGTAMKALFTEIYGERFFG